MGLRSIDLTKIIRLSLRGVKHPGPEEPVKETAYSRLLAINPLLAELVKRFDLEIGTTEEEPVKPGPNPELKALAEKIIKGQESYSKEEILARIKENTNISQERAERSFNSMLKAGVIERTVNPDLYYLGGSTPF